MSVVFKLHTPPKDGEGQAVETEYVEIPANDKDVVSRVATDVDRNRYKREYATFLKETGRERPAGLDAVEPEKVAEPLPPEPASEPVAAPAEKSEKPKRSRAKKK